MSEAATTASVAACLARIRELEARLEEADDTLDAIRLGAIDAVVVSGATEHRVYTLESGDRPYRVLIEQIQEGAVTLGADGTVFYCNRHLAAMVGTAQEKVIGHGLQAFLAPEDRPAFQHLLAQAGGGSARGELTLAGAPVSVSLNLLHRDEGPPLICGVVSDLTQQKRHVRELSNANARLVAESAQRKQVEEALRQSQKMEAVGQLTGGLAHDFNNLLTGIMGSLQLMRTRIGQGRTADLDRYIAAALASGDRAAALTHRLLAFSRRQTLDPKLVEANRLVAGMLELMQRTVGATVQVTTELGDRLGAILCDPHQLENALLNLAINARDAMPGGGRLTIRTANDDVADDFAASRDMAPGRYVVVSVTDDGAGMTPEVVGRAFDPFFTTKPTGMGTGLGLSMIYGFVKQSGGHARIHSQPGVGTTIQLYFPRLDTLVPSVAEAVAKGDAPRALRGETVLVVDDEPVVRMLVVEVLEELGYTALQADDGAAALHCLEGAGPIDLLVTDVGLPGGLNGRQLADAARVKRPGLKVLFVTGFAETTSIGNGTMEPGMAVMTKPFALDELAAKIQSIING